MASPPSNNSPSRTRTRTNLHTDSIPDTTFVHADPSTFRLVVQRLTGKSNAADPVVSPRRLRRPSFFKLHERRPPTRNLQIKLNTNNSVGAPSVHSPARNQRSAAALIGDISNYCKIVVASPVSPLEYAAARGSPRSRPKSPMLMEEGDFSLHNPRGSDPPELLPLFPLHSDDDYTVS